MFRIFAQADRRFLALFASVLTIGLAMLSSASWPLGFEKFGNGYYLVLHQIIYGVLPGLVLFLAAFMVPYQWYRRFAGSALLLSIVLLILVFIPGIGATFGSSHSWISIFGFSLQPSELVKLTFLIYLAGWLEARGKQELQSVAGGLMPFLTVLGVIMGLLILQPDTGSMGIIVFMSLAVYFAAGAPVRYFAALSLMGAVLMWLLLVISPYRAARFTTFLHPELDPQGIGYHINQALLAVGSGGVMGRGYGHSLQKFQYLPEVAGDSIFAVMSEELGFVLTVGFLVLYAAFLLRGLKIAERAPDEFGKYLVVGIVAWIGFQAFVNIGAMLGILPITGVPLPFISYGGTAVAAAMAGVGVIASVSRR